jgi:hypothetical protein
LTSYAESDTVETMTNAAARGAFPLRFKDEKLRELVREVAETEQVSQTDLIEEAVAHELIFRGARLANDLAEAADRISRLTELQRAELIDRSIDEFAAGESLPDPLQARALHSSPGQLEEPTEDPLGVLEAFNTARS